MKQFLLLTLLLAFTASAFEFTVKVVSVADGDTITVLAEGNKQQHKIRFQHIDCPESTQAFGAKAKQALSEKVFGKTVTVKWKEMDRYKRILGDVYLDQRWINAEMVQNGMAWHYKFYSKDATIAAAETKARAAKLGIWSQANPTPPLGTFVKKEWQTVRHPRRAQPTQRSSPLRAGKSITATVAAHWQSQSSPPFFQKQRPQGMEPAKSASRRSSLHHISP